MRRTVRGLERAYSYWAHSINFGSLQLLTARDGRAYPGFGDVAQSLKLSGRTLVNVETMKEKCYRLLDQFTNE